MNIYTIRVDERDVKFGISPNDLLPIRIPIVSNILDIIPFQVPIPFKSEGFSLGSGFLINREGYILTNAHVISNAVNIHVVLAEGKKEYPAKIIGIDRLTDTALIKIEPDFVPTVLPFGDSDKLQMGEMVLAIGNPLGFQHSVTSGLIQRQGEGYSTPETAIQTFCKPTRPSTPAVAVGPSSTFMEKWWGSIQLLLNRHN